jgi:hypothetical protein
MKTTSLAIGLAAPFFALPAFLLAALKDPIGANLGRVQAIWYTP